MKTINTKTITLGLVALLILGIAGFAQARGFNNDYGTRSAAYSDQMLDAQAQKGMLYGHRHGGGHGHGGYGCGGYGGYHR